MRITLDLSPFVHHHAGLGRYAGELTAALARVAPQHEYIGLYHATREIPIDGELRNLKTARVPLNAKPWRMSVLLAYYARWNMDHHLPACDLFHATDHLLPPLKNARSVFTIHDLILLEFPNPTIPILCWMI